MARRWTSTPTGTIATGTTSSSDSCTEARNAIPEEDSENAGPRGDVRRGVGIDPRGRAGLGAEGTATGRPAGRLPECRQRDGVVGEAGVLSGQRSAGPG